MPALLDAPTEPNPFSDLIPKDLIGGENGAPAYQTVGGQFSAVPKAEINVPTDYGAFSDLVPNGGSVTGAQNFGLFSDLVPKSPTSETEKAVAETPVISEFDKNFLAAEKGVSNLSGIPFHQTMNVLRSLSAGAGKYIFEGLQGFEFNRAKALANPPSELIQPQGDEIVLPDGSVMSKEQQNALEQRYRDQAIAQIPDAKAHAEYFKQIAQNADTSQYVDPELANTIPARIAHAAGSAGVMALESLIPAAGIPLMVVHGAMATEAEAKNAGKTDQEAEAAGVRSAIGLALFGGASKLAALGVAQLLPEGAAPLTKFVSQFTGQEIANETSSRAIDAWNAASNAPEGKKIEAALNALKDTTLEQSTLNAVYALAHASNAAGGEPVRPAGAPEPAAVAKTPETTPSVAGEPIEQAPRAEVLKPEPQPQGEPNALQIPRADAQVSRPTETGQDKSRNSERVGPSEQGPETAGTVQVPQEPIGVADAIAEIQRRNAPAPPIGEHGVSRAARAAANEVDVTTAEHNSAEAHVQRGNKLIAEGADPNVLVNEAISRNAWSTDAVDAAIAKDAELTAKARAARRAADADPSMEAAAVEAEKAAQAWEDTAIRPIRGQFHETGMSLQSARNLDTGDYIDYSKTFVEKNGRAPNPKEEAILQKATRKIRDLNAADARDLNQMDRTGGRPRKTLDPKRLREELAALKEKMLADCVL